MSDIKLRSAWVRRFLPNYTVDQIIAIRRSRVRTVLTHAATLFLFGGGAGVIGFLLLTADENNRRVEAAVDLFQAILPIAAAIVSFWFAGRLNADSSDPDDDDEG